MADKTKDMCAHPACNCMVPEGEKYCSAYCHDAADTTEIACNCEHAGCSISKSGPIGFTGSDPIRRVG